MDGFNNFFDSVGPEAGEIVWIFFVVFTRVFVAVVFRQAFLENVTSERSEFYFIFLFFY